MRSISSLILTASLLPLLASCQTSGPPALSLEEAKQITAQFSGSFTPPPRTIKDITAILDQEKRADPAAPFQCRWRT